jgi:AcrR family transcriptional regulator
MLLFGMEQMSRVERKKLAAQNRILEAAERLFLRKDGYEKTTIRDIAELADVSTGAVYMHFSGKADMLAVLLDRIVDEYKQEFVSIWEGGKPALKKIEEYVNHFFYLIRQPKFLAYIHLVRRLDPEEVRASMTSSMMEKQRRFYDLLRGAILEGQKDGSIQEFDSPEIMALIFMYTTRSFARELTEEHSMEERMCLFPDFSRDRALELLKKMLISSITKNSSGH